MKLDDILDKLGNFQDFAELYRTNGNPWPLGNHQLVPVYDMVENGLKRVLLAFATGAGKTVVPLEVAKHNPGNVLVVAPMQSMQENWDDATLRRHGLQRNLHQMVELKDATVPSQTDFLVVNYDKIYRARYLEQILNFAETAALVVPDECHNAKSYANKTTKAMVQIIEASKGARLAALSASPAPNKMRDMGIILYALDPERYEHYKSKPFHVREDPEAIWEMREKGQIRFFDRRAVQGFFGLPDFRELEPFPVSMSKRFEAAYFDAFQECFNIGQALNNLERISIEAMIDAPETKAVLRQKVNEGYVLNFFSHLRNQRRGDDVENAVFARLSRMLREIGVRRIEEIHGDTKKQDRIDIQRRMANGEVDALINQWKCTSEGFSEVTGDLRCFIVPLRSPFAPGMQDQIIGRSYRPGCRAIVEYAEFHPDSPRLRDRMETWVRNYAEEYGVRVRSTWAPSLFHHDAWQIRKGKQAKMFVCLHGRGDLIEDSQLNIGSLIDYGKTLSKRRVLDYRKRDVKFGSGLRQVSRFVGTSYGSGLVDNADPLGRDYDRDDLLKYVPGKINTFVAQTVEALKVREGVSEVPWRIADLGCCSTAPFAQSRLMWQAVRSVEGDKVGLDEIVNVDGQDGFLLRAQEYLEKGEWLEAVRELEMEDVSPESLEKAADLLRREDYMRRLEFVHANFVRESYGGPFDVVVASQSLQYNDQSENRDIERITMGVNRSLREGGHYLVALTGNTFTNSFTRPQDIANVLKILDMYGFEVRRVLDKYSSGESFRDLMKSISAMTPSSRGAFQVHPTGAYGPLTITSGRKPLGHIDFSTPPSSREYGILHVPTEQLAKEVIPEYKEQFVLLTDDKPFVMHLTGGPNNGGSYLCHPRVTNVEGDWLLEMVEDAKHAKEGSFRRWWENHPEVAHHESVGDESGTVLRIEELEFKRVYRLSILD